MLSFRVSGAVAIALLTLILTQPIASAHGGDPGSDATLIDKLMIGSFRFNDVQLAIWQVTAEANPTHDFYLASLTIIQKNPDFIYSDMLYWFRWGPSTLWQPTPQIVDYDPAGGQVGDIDITYTVGVSAGPTGPGFGFSMSFTNHIDGWWTVETGTYFTRRGDWAQISWHWVPLNPWKDFGKLSAGSEARVLDGHTYYVQGRAAVVGMYCDAWFLWSCVHYSMAIEDTGYFLYRLPDLN
jgi:hypothetical protein